MKHEASSLVKDDALRPLASYTDAYSSLRDAYASAFAGAANNCNGRRSDHW